MFSIMTTVKINVDSNKVSLRPSESAAGLRSSSAGLPQAPPPRASPPYAAPPPALGVPTRCRRPALPRRRCRRCRRRLSVSAAAPLVADYVAQICPGWPVTSLA